MTENQLNKLKGRLLNIQTQINGACILLSKKEPQLNSKMQEANKIIADALIACESIKTEEVEPVQPKKKHKAYTHEVVREGNFSIRSLSAEPKTTSPLLSVE